MGDFRGTRVQSTYSSFSQITRDMAGTLSRYASQPSTKLEIAYWKANVGKVTSIDSFVGNPRLLNFAMKAYGMSDLTYAKGFVRKLLEGGVATPATLANRLSDKRCRRSASSELIAAAGIFGASVAYCSAPVCGVRNPFGPTERTSRATAP